MKIKFISVFLSLITLIFIISGCSSNNAENKNNDSSFANTDSNNTVVNEATIAIRCDAVLKHYDDLDESLKSEEFVPSDGYILHETKFSLKEDETAYDLLVRATKENKITLDSENASISAFGTAYIKGINSLYEKSCGDFSGWMFLVNGEMLNVGSSEFKLNNNDIVEFIYVCDYNTDIDLYTGTESISGRLPDSQEA